MRLLRDLIAMLRGDGEADRVVPPTGFTVWLTQFSSGAMAFLAVFALALSMSAGRLAERWESELARSATVRISAPEGQVEAQVKAVVQVLETTPGTEAIRVLSTEEQHQLLEPWFGPDLPLDALPIPKMVEFFEVGEGYDTEGLRLRLRAEAPGAVLDDHTRWRKPLIRAASRLRSLGFLSIFLIVMTTAAMITLAAQAALSANSQVIRVLRLVGARDVYIARAFVRRFSMRALSGATAGTLLSASAIAILPSAGASGGFLTGLGFQGSQWLWLGMVPLLSTFVGFWATRVASFRTLKELK